MENKSPRGIPKPSLLSSGLREMLDGSGVGTGEEIFPCPMKS